MWLGGAISDYWSLDLGPVSLLVTWNGYTPVLEGGVGFHRTCSFFVQQPDLFALMGQVKSQISNFFPWSASRNDRFFLNLSPHHRRLFISRREGMNSKESLLRRYTFFSTFLLWILSVSGGNVGCHYLLCWVSLLSPLIQLFPCSFTFSIHFLLRCSRAQACSISFPIPFCCNHTELLKRDWHFM